MVPEVTSCVATSGRERFMIVCEKKVSTSSTARKMMAMVLMSSLFLDFSFTSIGFYPFNRVSGAEIDFAAAACKLRGLCGGGRPFF